MLQPTFPFKLLGTRTSTDLARENFVHTDRFPQRDISKVLGKRSYESAELLGPLGAGRTGAIPSSLPQFRGENEESDWQRWSGTVPSQSRELLRAPSATNLQRLLTPIGNTGRAILPLDSSQWNDTPRAVRNESSMEPESAADSNDAGGLQNGHRREPLLQKGQTWLQMMVPNHTVPLIIGPGGSTIRQLQETSGCHIYIAGEDQCIDGLRPVDLVSDFDIEAPSLGIMLIRKIVYQDQQKKDESTQDRSGSGIAWDFSDNIMSYDLEMWREHLSKNRVSTQDSPPSASSRSVADPNKDQPSNTLITHDLPLETSEADLKDFFLKQRGFKRMTFSNPGPRPICLLEFENVAHAARAREKFDGCLIPNTVNGELSLKFSPRMLPPPIEEAFEPVQGNRQMVQKETGKKILAATQSSRHLDYDKYSTIGSDSEMSDHPRTSWQTVQKVTDRSVLAATKARARALIGPRRKSSQFGALQAPLAPSKFSARFGKHQRSLNTPDPIVTQGSTSDFQRFPGFKNAIHHRVGKYKTTVQTLFMKKTISEDCRDDSDAQMKSRLWALGMRSEEPETQLRREVFNWATDVPQDVQNDRGFELIFEMSDQDEDIHSSG